MENRPTEILVIGGANADLLLSPVDARVFTVGSWPAEQIRLTAGGDALNESVALADMGHAAAIATLSGDDRTADFLEDFCREAGVKTHFVREASIETSINAVLVAEDGQRCFVTNPNSSIRRLSLAHLAPVLAGGDFRSAKICALASMFVSPALTLDDMASLFSTIRAAGKTVCADTTKRKHGETLADAREAMSKVDYWFPNLEEARLLTGGGDPDAVADAFLDAGVKHVALKLGDEGCLLCSRKERWRIPAHPVGRAIDTTGAGDNFSAAFQAGLLEGRPFCECGALACARASFAVEALGATVHPDKCALEARCEALLRRARRVQ